MLSVQTWLEKFSAFPRGQISRISATVSPTEGRIAIVTNAGWDAVDAAASGAPDIAGQVSWPVSDRPGAQDERRFNAFARSSLGSTWPVEGMTEAARVRRSRVVLASVADAK